MPVKKSSNKKSEVSKFKKIVKIIFSKTDNLSEVSEGYSMSTPQAMDSTGGDDEFQFDIAHRFYTTANSYGQSLVGVNEVMPVPMADGKKFIRITTTPKAVVGELEESPKALSLEGLDAKIEILKDKAELVRQYHTQRELKVLITCFENRKKYAEHAPFFSQFQTTRMEKVETLLAKYELVIKDADLFIPEFPTEAVAVMKEYSKRVKEITGLKPTFKVIATEKGFEDVDGKRDPILLGISPFGFYFDILGAWDKEMVLLSEL